MPGSITDLRPRRAIADMTRARVWPTRGPKHFLPNTFAEGRWPMSAEKGLKNWHAVIAGGSRPTALAAVIHEDAVFHSPVVHTPQAGSAIVVAYLAAAGQTLGNDSFSYRREGVDGDTAVHGFPPQP